MMMLLEFSIVTLLDVTIEVQKGLDWVIWSSENQYPTSMHGFYSTSFLFHIIGYIVFQFKQIYLEFYYNIFECTYELFLHSVV